MHARLPTLLQDLAGQVFALAVAFAGGAFFAWLGIPAAWLSGAMIATAIAAASGAIRPMMAPLRDFSMLVAGVSLGMGVTPEALNALASYPASLTLLALGMTAILFGSMFVLVNVCRWPARDALFASAPGSLSAVLMIAADVRADVARIAILQSFRIFFLVMVLPSVITALEPEAPPIVLVQSMVTPGGLAVIFAASWLVAAILGRLGVVAPLVMGAMLGSAVLAGSDLVPGRMPGPISTFGFVVVGAFIGQRFRGLNLADFVRLMPAIIVSLISTLVIAAVFAALVSLVTGIPLGLTVVAFAPGGLEAMSMLALALGLDPLYVGVHHLVRFVLVGLLVPVVLKLWPTLARNPHAGD